jgi:transposase-like protein
MSKSSMMFALMVVVVAGVARADYPLADMVAGKIIAKYQNSTCQQLWQEKAENQGKPKPEMEQRAIQMLREDAGMRADFFGKISTPIVTKMFECGMIP